MRNVPTIFQKGKGRGTSCPGRRAKKKKPNRLALVNEKRGRKERSGLIPLRGGAKRERLFPRKGKRKETLKLVGTFRWEKEGNRTHVPCFEVKKGG